MNVRRRGFTLVELVVAIAIIGIVVTVGAVSLNKFGSTQKIEEARDGLISSLRLARNYAITGQNVAGVGGTLSYITVEVSADGNVKIYPNVSDTMTYLNKDISPVGVVITANTLRFASYDGKLVGSNGVPVGAEVVFLISAGAGMEDPGSGALTVNVSSLGLINE